MQKIETLFELLSEYQVEIPIVQRDYAQGRSDKHSTSVRKNILRDMRNAIEGTGVLDLNFIYGKTENGKFIPLDGQQRLTTLFLVYIYAFANDETKTPLLRKFTYETRASSREFIINLVENRAEVFNSINKPSEEITDSTWYRTVWDYDPTVQSIKVVLDELMYIWDGMEGLNEKLSDNSKVPIRFNFLSMDDLGMEDSLYIKMNARGRTLTPFENYKALLISQVQTLYSRKELCIEPQDFEHRLDCDWTTLFWDYYCEKDYDEHNFDTSYFDTIYKDFFEVLFSSYANLHEETGYVDSINFKDISPIMIEAAYHTLNYLCSPNSKQEVRDLIFRCLGGRCPFQQRIMFYAVSVYMMQAKGNVMEASLTQWIRIIGNLTYNTNEDTIGRAENFAAVAQSIIELSKNWNNILEFFAEQTFSLRIFAPPQIEEEQIKAKLIIRSSEFSSKIHKAECHKYFSGQIRSALLAAGITREIVKEVDHELLKEKMHLFDLYWEKIIVLFNEKGPVFGMLMRQALLAQKDYTMKTGAYHSFGVDNPNDPVSFKALFADANQANLIRNLLDSFPTSAENDIKQSLEYTINNAVLSEKDWRYCFVRYPQLFESMSKQYMRIYKGSNILIVRNKSTSGFNFEVFTFTLHTILGHDKSEYPNICGSSSEYFMTTKVDGKQVKVGFKEKAFEISDENLYSSDPPPILLRTKEKPLSEVLSFLEQEKSE